MHNMSVKEISNSHLQATFWHAILELGQKNPASHWDHIIINMLQLSHYSESFFY